MELLGQRRDKNVQILYQFHEHRTYTTAESYFCGFPKYTDSLWIVKMKKGNYFIQRGSDREFGHSYINIAQFLVRSNY